MRGGGSSRSCSHRACAAPAAAIYLDDDQNISLRTRIYSQAAIRLNDSQGDTTPTTKRGQLVQHRNFFNPEFEAKLTSYTTWMKDSWLSFLAPDDFSARLAAWGFYDGIYDYGSSQFHDTAAKINAAYPDVTKQTGAFIFEGPTFNPKGKTLDTIFPGVEVQNPHDIYASQRRVNELYLNYTKGPVLPPRRQAKPFRGASPIPSPSSTRTTRSISPWALPESSRTLTRRASRCGRCAPASPLRLPRPAVQRLRRGLLGSR